MNLAPRHYGIIFFSLATAILHLLCAPYFGWLDSIVLNGFGSLALLGAYFLPIPYFQERKRIVYWAIVAYTLLTIVLWVFMGDKTFKFDTTAAIGYYAKIAETFLLVFMGFDLPTSSVKRARVSNTNS